MASSATSGSGGDTAMSANTDDMRATAVGLTEVGQAAATLRLAPLTGTGADARVLQEGVARFCATWEAPLHAWGSALGSLAASVTSVADTMEDGDEAMAHLWKGMTAGFSS